MTKRRDKTHATHAPIASRHCSHLVHLRLRLLLQLLHVLYRLHRLLEHLLNYAGPHHLLGHVAHHRRQLRQIDQPLHGLHDLGGLLQRAGDAQRGQLVLHLHLHGVEVRLGGVDASDRFARVHHLLGEDRAGGAIALGGRLLKRLLALVLLALDGADLAVELVALLADFVAPFVDLRKCDPR